MRFFETASVSNWDTHLIDALTDPNAAIPSTRQDNFLAEFGETLAGNEEAPEAANEP